MTCKRHKWKHVANFLVVRLSNTKGSVRKQGRYECTTCGAEKVGSPAIVTTQIEVKTNDEQ